MNFFDYSKGPSSDRLIKNLMTQPNTDLRFSLAMERGEVREAMGWSFVRRQERLADELLAKPDCPNLFWIVYSAKWDDKARTIRELWQVTDEKPRTHMLGQIITEIDKSGHCHIWALPLDIPVPDEVYEGGETIQNHAVGDTLILSDQIFEKI